jgi:hypothetical protein
MGSDLVVSVVDSKIEDILSPIVFSQYGCTSMRARVFNIQTTMGAQDEAFKEIWLMYVVYNVLFSTMSNHVSNMCYLMMVSFLAFFLCNLFVSLVGNFYGFKWVTSMF